MGPRLTSHDIRPPLSQQLDVAPDELVDLRHCLIEAQEPSQVGDLDSSPDEASS